MSPRRIVNQQFSNVDVLAEEIKRRVKPEIKFQTPVTVEESQEPQEDFIIFYPPNGGRQELLSGNVISVDFWEGIVRNSDGSAASNLSSSLQLKGKSAIYSLRVISKAGQFNIRINENGVKTVYSGDFKINGFPIRKIELWSPNDDDLMISLMASTSTNTDFSGGVRFQDSFVEDKVFLRVAEYNLMVAKGEVENHATNHIIGNGKTTISTTAFVLLSNITATQPTANTAMKLVSTSVNDAAGGTGAQQITIKYFEFDWGAEKSEVISLNGVTPVNLLNTNVYRISEMFVSRAGSTQNAAGTIQLKDVATGTIIYGQIDQGTAFFERAVHYIANKRECIITGMTISSSTSGGVIWRLFTTKEDTNGNIVPRAEFSGEIAMNSLFLPFKMPIVLHNPNNKRMSIGIAVKGLTSNQGCTSTIRFFEEDT